LRIRNQEIVSLVIAAITDEADGLYELAKSVQPSLAVAHAHALNGALHLLVNLLSEMDDEKGRNAGPGEGFGLPGETSRHFDARSIQHVHAVSCEVECAGVAARSGAAIPA